MNDTLIGILIGGVIAGLPGIVVAILNNRNSRQTSLESSSIAAAIKYWDFHVDFAKNSTRVVGIRDPQSYIIYATLVSEAIRKGRLNPKKAETLKEINSIMCLVDEAQEAQTKKA